MRQVSKLFEKYDNTGYDVSDQLNIFLNHHPGYQVANIQYNGYKDSVKEELFVVFNIDETIEPSPVIKLDRYVVRYINPNTLSCIEIGADTENEAEQMIENYVQRVINATPNGIFTRCDNVRSEDGIDTRLLDRESNKLYIWTRLWKRGLLNY